MLTINERPDVDQLTRVVFQLTISQVLIIFDFFKLYYHKALYIRQKVLAIHSPGKLTVKLNSFPHVEDVQ